jgi:uncharacterized protein (TIRG00374 family)
MDGKFAGNRKKIVGILQVLLSLVLLVWFIGRAGLQEVVATLTSIDPGWYFLAFLLFQLNVLIRAYRWYILLRALNDRPGYLYLVYLYYVGFFANNFIPSGFGGDLVKVITLRQSHGRGAEALSSVLMERVTGLVGSSLIALIALLWNLSSHTADLELPPLLWATVAIFSLGIPILFFLARWLDPLAYLSSRWTAVTRLPFYDKVERLVNTIHRYSKRTLLYSLLISLPFTLNLVFVQIVIAHALGIDLPFAVFALFVPLIALVNLLPITFNGLGLREGTYQFLFMPIGVSSAGAIAMSLAFYFLRFSAGLVGGLLYAMRSLTGLVTEPRTENLRMKD